MVRAVLEAIAYQVKEVVLAINFDCDGEIALLKVDGGACENNFLMQFQADVLGIPVERPAVFDATAQGAAFGAGERSGFLAGLYSASCRAQDRPYFSSRHRRKRGARKFCQLA